MNYLDIDNHLASSEPDLDWNMDASCLACKAPIYSGENVYRGEDYCESCFDEVTAEEIQ